MENFIFCAALPADKATTSKSFTVYLWGVFITQSSIYDSAILRKINKG